MNNGEVHPWRGSAEQRALRSQLGKSGCGILARGFLRLRCAHCAHEKLVAFSCRRRDFCLSCGAGAWRRPPPTCDHVIPRVPVRQWVLSFPIPLRLLFATHPELLAPVLRIVHRVIPDRHRAAGSCRRPSEEETRKPGPGIGPAGRAEDATLYCYITRPAIANERLALNRAGQVVLTLKTPYREGTTHIVMSPLEFIQRPAALVPRPSPRRRGSHLIRFHGVLAPEATQGGACLARRGRSTRLRPDIIPSFGRQAGNLPVPGFPNVPVNANTPQGTTLLPRRLPP